MTDLLREQLSAFMDGELPTEECALLVRRVSADAELVECWHSWHLIGDSLNDEAAPRGAERLAERVERALAGATTGAGRRLRYARWNMRRTATIAASVAVLGLAGLVGALVMRQMSGGGEVLVPGAAGTVATPIRHVDWRQAPQPVRAELNRYLLMHEVYGAGAIPPSRAATRGSVPASLTRPGAGGH